MEVPLPPPQKKTQWSKVGCFLNSSRASVSPLLSVKLCPVEDKQALWKQNNSKLAYKNKAGIINTAIVAPSDHFLKAWHPYFLNLILHGTWWNISKTSKSRHVFLPAFLTVTGISLVLLAKKMKPILNKRPVQPEDHCFHSIQIVLLKGAHA